MQRAVIYFGHKVKIPAPNKDFGVSMLCILNVGTVPMLCILYVGTVPTFRHSHIVLQLNKEFQLTREVSNMVSFQVTFLKPNPSLS